MTPSHSKPLTDAEVCDALRFSARTLRRLIADSELAKIDTPSRCRGRLRRWPVSICEVLAWAERVENWRLGSKIGKGRSPSGGNFAGSTAGGRSRTKGQRARLSMRSKHVTLSGSTIDRDLLRLDAIKI